MRLEEFLAKRERRKKPPAVRRTRKQTDLKSKAFLLEWNTRIEKASKRIRPTKRIRELEAVNRAVREISSAENEPASKENLATIAKLLTRAISEIRRYEELKRSE